MNAIELLKDRGLKKTAPRVMLLTILLETKAVSLTENDIKAEMGDLYDRVTFYRTAQTLIEAGIIHKITVNNITKYALSDYHTAGRSNNHAHFYCKNCHSITCLEGRVPVEYHLPEAFSFEECDILIKGMCNSCLDADNG